MTFVIRAATRDDAEQIATVHVDSWRAGYRHVVPASVLDADEFESSRRSMWTQWRFNPGQRVVVCIDAEREGRTIGFAAFGPERERARGFTGRGELYAFYFHPDAWGNGAASALLAHVDERLRAEGFVEAVLWVLKDNPRGRAFYEKHGWTATGVGGEFDASSDLQLPEIEYRKELA